jgi:hypothetical protein
MRKRDRETLTETQKTYREDTKKNRETEIQRSRETEQRRRDRATGYTEIERRTETRERDTEPAYREISTIFLWHIMNENANKRSEVHYLSLWNAIGWRVHSVDVIRNRLLLAAKKKKEDKDGVGTGRAEGVGTTRREREKYRDRDRDNRQREMGEEGREKRTERKNLLSFSYPGYSRRGRASTRGNRDAI